MIDSRMHSPACNFSQKIGNDIEPNKREDSTTTKFVIAFLSPPSCPSPVSSPPELT